MEQGDFPKQVPLGARSVVWVKSQVEDWCAKKVSADLGVADPVSGPVLVEKLNWCT